jgi:uncharacterized protein (TIGR02145 family)/uncharacterized repeat protein (TIGR02543 family)
MPKRPARKGYTFEGWFTSATGGTEVTSQTEFKVDGTVYARWTAGDDLNYGIFTDSRDQTPYYWTKIGTQTWMAENLNWDNTDVTEPCANNDCDTYGRMYTWAVASEQACPTTDGWHLPTVGEWSVLWNYVGADADKKLKALPGTGGWNVSLGLDDGWDSYNFSALGGGYAPPAGTSFVGVGAGGYWWSATEAATTTQANYFLSTSGVASTGFVKTRHMNVRCVKN